MSIFDKLLPHKHTWEPVSNAATYMRCSDPDCGLLAKKGKSKQKKLKAHKHVFGPWKQKFASLGDQGGFQARYCKVDGCNYEDSTSIGHRWYPNRWRVHLH